MNGYNAQIIERSAKIVASDVSQQVTTALKTMESEPSTEQPAETPVDYIPPTPSSSFKMM